MTLPDCANASIVDIIRAASGSENAFMVLQEGEEICLKVKRP